MRCSKTDLVKIKYHCHFVTLKKLSLDKSITTLCIITIDFNLNSKRISYQALFDFSSMAILSPTTKPLDKQNQPLDNLNVVQVTVTKIGWGIKVLLGSSANLFKRANQSISRTNLWTT